MNDNEKRLLFLHIEEIKQEVKELQKPSIWLDLKGSIRYSACSRSTILRAIKSNKLKHTKQTGKIRIKTSWIDQWLLFGHCRRLTPKQRTEMER
ncbi:MAG: hypothetical protein H8D23_11920 [Candidatus Brocadiales bacterium]|nr:hypothetical protein [Candidatus Brocadiales bacterium]